MGYEHVLFGPTKFLNLNLDCLLITVCLAKRPADIVIMPPTRWWGILFSLFDMCHNLRPMEATVLKFYVWISHKNKLVIHFFSRQPYTLLMFT